MQRSIEDITARVQIARRDFNRTLIELGDVTEEQADKITDLYLEKRIARIDIGIGKINVKHGAFLDRDAIRMAATMI